MDDLAARQRRLQRVDALGGDAVVVFKLQVRERAQRREKLVIEIAPSRGAQIERGELRQQGERGDVGDRVVREIELAQLRAAGERGNVRDAAARKVERFDRFGEVQPAERHRTRALHDAVAEYAAAGQRFLQVFEHIVRDLHALNGECRERRERREDGKVGDRIPVEIQRAQLRERGERRSVRHGVIGENERAQLRKFCKKMHVRNIAVRQRERREISERGDGGAVPGRERLSGKLKAVRRGIDIHSGDGETGGGTGGGGHFWRRCRVRVGFPAGRTLQKQKQQRQRQQDKARGGEYVLYFLFLCDRMHGVLPVQQYIKS